MAAEKSNLSGVGCLLMIVGLVGGIMLSKSVREGGGSRMAALGADGLRLLVAVGLCVMIIGFVRNARK